MDADSTDHSPSELAPALEHRLIEQEHALLFERPHAGSRKPYERDKPPPHVLEDRRILRAIRYIEAHLDRPLSLDRLAARASLSTFHFQRHFREVMGESPSEYIRRTRLDRAAIHLLIYPESVLSIALSVGYSSHEAFIRAFHRQFALTPTQYRQFARQASIPATAEEHRRASEVQITHLPDLALLSMRFYGSYARVAEHWRHFAEELQRIGYPLDNARAIGAITDNPEITPNDLVRYDCAVVDLGLPIGDAPLSRMRLPAGRYACLQHRAPYNQVFAAYRTLAVAWPESSGERFVPQGGYELYRQPPWSGDATQCLDIAIGLES